MAGDEVVFAALDYGAMVGSWRQDAALAGHVAAIERAFAPWPTAGARE